MRAALCKSLDGAEGIEFAELPEPAAGAGEAVVKVKAVGLNFADTLITRGKYQFKPDLPFSPGAEIAGEIESVGAGVRSFAPGARVTAYVNWGGAREKIVVKAESLIPVPAAVPDTIAASVCVTYGTAVHGLKNRARLAPGETVVVTGAAGGAGQAAVEIAKLMQARVIAVASTEEKCAIAAAAGADETVVYPGSDLKEAVRELTGSHGADVVYECVGGNASEPLVRALAWQGRFLVVGFASGEIPKVPINLLLLRGADMLGVFWGEAVRRAPAEHADNIRMLLDWVAYGRLKPRVQATFPLERIADALRILERREATGKIVLTL